PDRLSAELVIPSRKSFCPHGVGDEDQPLRSDVLPDQAEHLFLDVDAIRNQFRLEGIQNKCRSDYTDIPVMDSRHGVAQMGHLADALFSSILHSYKSGIGVSCRY